MATDSSSSGEVTFDGAPFFRVYKDGHVERLMGTDVVPPSLDPATGVASKDVVVDPATGVWVRLYLPPPAASHGHNSNPKLPVLVYFHGGAFVIESASSPTYHNYLNSVAVRARVLAVSVDYRRAPEHPLPAAYDDSWAALQWVASHAIPSTASVPVEPWLAEHGDLSCVFLAGDSAGANIAHNMAMRAGAEGLGSGVGLIEGIILTHPYFSMSPQADEEERKKRDENFWRFLYPSSAQWLEEPCVNPAAAGAPSLAGLGCGRVLVCLAERDFLREEGRRYHEALRGSGFAGKVELLDSPGEEHVFHLFKPGCDRAVDKMERIVAFIQGAAGPGPAAAAAAAAAGAHSA